MKCKNCNSENLIKSGKQIYADGRHQMYRCKECFKITKGNVVK